MSTGREFGRIDFTYWPQTGEVEWHGHPKEDVQGDTPPQGAPLEMIEKALVAVRKTIQQRARNAAAFDAAMRRRGC